MADFQVPSWLSSAFSGGLAGSLLTLLVGWIKSGIESKRIRIQQKKALTEELRHAQWIVEYNYGRIGSPGLPHKGLTSISATNVEQILFSSTTKLSLPTIIIEYLHDYLQQVVYHNSLVVEYSALMLEPPQPSKSVWVDPKNSCLGEIQAICTPEATYKNRDEPSLRARIERLLSELSKIKPMPQRLPNTGSTGRLRLSARRR